MKFHEKLYTLRKEADMTQTDLAEKLNVSRQAVSRWEMGTAMPDIDNLIAISDLFNVTLDDLLKNKEAAPGETSPPAGNDRPRFWDFVPRKWWIPLAVSIGCTVVAYIRMFVYMAFPKLSAGTTAAGDVSGFYWLWMLFFSVPGARILTVTSMVLTAGCFIWALVKLQKFHCRK